MRWTEPNGTRIWRCPAEGTTADDVFNSAAFYTDAVLARLAEEGFNGIWVYALLYNLMRSRVFPELNRPGAEERLMALQELIDRARRHGIGVYLYFNDPVSIDIDDPFWQKYAELHGAEKWHTYALCTSTPQVQSFFRDALESTFAPLRNLEGVILITACESLTHCWSKTVRRDGALPACPRCRDREPAALVLELLQTWSEVSHHHPTPFRILAWNWEWAYWYPHPQLPIVSHLPDGMELLLGYEMGGTRRWGDRIIPVGEYAFSFAGPGEQFILTRQAAAERGIPVHAKIELNNTHEICSVPNVPVLRTLHTRFAAMARDEVAGFLGCWSMGGKMTLNTHAMRLFLRDPEQYLDEQTFLAALARDYFGLTATDAITRAWQQFSDAFTHYPFSVNLLYSGPHNDAPARRLSLHFEGTPTCASWRPGEPGDDLSRCIEPFFSDRQSFTLDDVIDGFTRLHAGWAEALRDYAALEADEPGSEEQCLHRRRELSCARMIAHQFRSIVNVFRFFREQQAVMQQHGLTAPCDIPPNATLREIMEDELANVRQALPLVEADSRLGYHQDIGGYKYNAEMMREKIGAMEAELGRGWHS